VNLSPLETFLSGIRQARFAGGVRCPRCSGHRIHRWGSFAGRQRYRCLGCSRTFSDLTGTAAAYLKKTVLLPAYASWWAEGLSVRRTALRLGIHSSTAFRWRHRLCRSLLDYPEKLSGRVEVADIRLVESRKGQPVLDRKPRKRRYDPARIWPRVGVVIACDRLGHVVTGVTPRPDHHEGLREVLGAHLGRAPTILASSGWLGPAARLARSVSAAFVDVRSQTDPRSKEHVQTARSYGLRFGRWLVRFRGVSTKYLANYLAWHRVVDRPDRVRPSAVAFRWPLELVRSTHISREQKRSFFLTGGVRPSG
jgi:transposase-like protein